MFSSKKWSIISKGLVEEYNKLLSELDKAEIEQLTKGMTKEDYFKKQLMQKDTYQETIKKLVEDKSIKINEASAEALKKALGVVENELNDLDPKIKLTTDEEILTSIESIKKVNKEMLEGVVQQTNIKHAKLINELGLVVNQPKILATSKVATQARITAITEAISRNINKPQGVLHQPPKIRYSNGREVSFRTYIEMAARTTIQNIAVEKMNERTDNLGIIFYLASEHPDCADDHKDYQGKIYIKDSWRTIIKQKELIPKIEAFINQKRIMTIEKAIAQPIWLSTRPNCRHYFIPITVQQALGNITELKSKLRTKKPGSYVNVKENYKDLQQQRQYEVAIRKWKDMRDKNLILYERSKNPTVLKQIERAKYYIAKYQEAQRNLLQSNPALTREYTREDNEGIVKDFGATKNK